MILTDKALISKFQTKSIVGTPYTLKKLRDPFYKLKQSASLNCISAAQLNYYEFRVCVRSDSLII